MQLKLTFSCNEDLIFDENNIRVMQGFIYKKLQTIDAEHIHNDAYQCNDKVFRHFCFSDIETEHGFISGGTINYGKQFSFYFATGLHEIVPNFCNALYQSPIEYGHRLLTCRDIKVVDSTINDNSINITTVSPVVVDRTIHIDGKKKRHYYAPHAEEFMPIVKKNLIDKYQSLHNITIDNAELAMDDVKNCKKITKNYIKSSKYKVFKIKIVGYQFSCRLSGDVRLIKTALYCGLGSKNAQGFGYILKK